MINKKLDDIIKDITILKEIFNSTDYFKKLEEIIDKQNNHNKELELKLNNLQSKIDKAIEYIEKNTHNIYAVGYRDRITEELLSKEKTPIINRVFSQNPKELLKILKEAENVEDN